MGWELTFNIVLQLIEKTTTKESKQHKGEGSSETVKDSMLEILKKAKVYI